MITLIVPWHAMWFQYVSAVLFFTLFAIWSKQGWINLVAKILFLGMGLWALVVRGVL